MDSQLEAWARATTPESITAATLSVIGFVPQAQTLSLDALRQMPRVELGPASVRCFSGRPIVEMSQCAGVRLIDLLDLAGLSALPRPDLKCCIVAASGVDGYQAFFSWNELYNMATGAEVLVLYERDGQPLDSHLGPLSLISAGDVHLGPRHLRQLDTLAVLKL